MFNKICSLLFLAGVLFSCQESEKERISRLVKEWDGKEIVFPDRPVFTIQGRDTVSCPSGNSPYKVLTYIDSLGCASCKLQLPRWKELMAEVDSVVSGRVPFLFYFHPKDMKEMRYITRRDGFTYPVCFDESDELNRLNRFPSEMAFQTFLLDADNRVVALGNPVHNPEVKSLYLRLLRGEGDAPVENQTVTAAELSTAKVDFGKFPVSEVQSQEVVLRNTGNRPLVIHDITTSCGCTRVEYDKRPVSVGGETSIRIIYEAEHPGNFRKTADVYCNIAASRLRITVMGVAE